MSEGFNRVMLLGNLGADPELRFTQGGQAVLNIRMAMTESYLDKDKVRRERTEWATVVVWGPRGEGLAKILKKGSSLFVEGRLQTSSYDDRDGNKRYKTEVIANNVVLTDRGRGSAGDEAGPPADGSGAPARGSGRSGDRPVPPSPIDGYFGGGNSRPASAPVYPPDDFGGGDTGGEIPF